MDQHKTAEEMRKLAAYLNASAARLESNDADADEIDEIRYALEQDAEQIVNDLLYLRDVSQSVEDLLSD